MIFNKNVMIHDKDTCVANVLKCKDRNVCRPQVNTDGFKLTVCVCVCACVCGLFAPWCCSEVECIKSNGTSLPTDIDKLLGELDPIADRQPVATPRPPAVMPRTGRSAADGRNAQVTDRLKEMHDEVAQHSEMARIAVTQLQDEVLARKAWERRYQEERKAR